MNEHIFELKFGKLELYNIKFKCIKLKENKILKNNIC